MEVHLEIFAVPALVRDLKDVLRPLLERKNNRLVVECSDDTGTMQADRIKVRQCLLNLLSNASKFTDQGVITLSASRVARRGIGPLPPVVSSPSPPSPLLTATSPGEGGGLEGGEGQSTLSP